MLFSTLQFFIAALLAVVCARVLGVSEGEIPLVAVLVPALWLIQKRSFASAVFFVSVLAYGLTLPHQPITLSVSVWILFPLLMVIFSKRSNMIAVAISALIVVTLQVGIMSTQTAGKLEGSAVMTGFQTLAVILIWWSVSHWKPAKEHRWWVLVLLLPLWVAQFTYGILFALSAIGIMSTLENLLKVKSFKWGKLLCWTLPTVGFAALVISPQVDVPNPVFVVWLCLLGTAWITDYILQSVEYNEEI
ncbi:hypothetical protein BIY21_00610 [Vibrio ponticus]|uniref:Integral membrane protein n=1 Tax=Vibrio ponticus TaxID=265668 RepID=A0A3N3DYJ1_9VIBR|nr:hypothetical protein [Vibrio ponticus]OLQ94334.1 hypothetical protein BIY21_00610 [Vibrio ponticus]ROV59449.1 hypothetical protein EGH82_13825 [Vibrio ponticus]